MLEGREGRGGAPGSSAPGFDGGRKGQIRSGDEEGGRATRPNPPGSTKGFPVADLGQFPDLTPVLE